MKRLIVITVVMVILITSCSITIHKRNRCKGNGGWYKNRNLSSISIDSIQKHQRIISYPHLMASYPH